MKTVNLDQRLINKTRRKIVILITVIVFLVFAFLDITYSVYSLGNEKNSIDTVLNQEMKSSLNNNPASGSSQPNKGDSPQFDNLRLFSIKLTTADQTYVFSKGSEYFTDFVKANLTTLTSSSSGRIGRIYFSSQTQGDYTYVVGTDRTIEYNNIYSSISGISIILISAWAVVFVMSFFFSKLILKPLEEAQIKQKEFIADASHELKTPLTIIDANASLLKDSKGKKWVSNIMNETKNMTGMINDMLSLAAVEEQETTLEEMNISEVITNSALAFEAVFYENGMKYSMDIKDGVYLECDKKDLEKIVKITLDNARKYTDKSGTVKVSLTEEKGKIDFSVYNTGCLIKDDEKDKVFNRFYRDPLSRDGNKNTGSGLGLSILKEITLKYGYSLNLDCKENEYFKITVGLKK